MQYIAQNRFQLGTSQYDGTFTVNLKKCSRCKSVNHVLLSYDNNVVLFSKFSQSPSTL